MKGTMICNSVDVIDCRSGAPSSSGKGQGRLDRPVQRQRTPPAGSLKSDKLRHHQVRGRNRKRCLPAPKETKLDQKLTVVDAQSKPITGATVNKVNGKEVVVDAEGKPLDKAQDPQKRAAATAIVDAKGKNCPNAKRSCRETVANPTGGWKGGEMVC